METFGEKISAEACSGKEIAGLLRKMMMMNDVLSIYQPVFMNSKDLRLILGFFQP